MNKENEVKLFDRFKFYRPELPETVSLMCYGFCCGDGWFDIIWDLSQKLEQIVDDDFNVFQVKEKFGELRFYFDVLDGKEDKIDREKVYKLIGEAEDKAASTCERCGKPSEIKTRNGWLSTICCK